MTEITIEPFAKEHRTWAAAHIKEAWGTPQQVSRGVKYNVLEFPGFVGRVDGQPQGLLTYRVDGNQYEVMMVSSAIAGIGLGAALMQHFIEQANEANIERIWLITTNDNIDAIRWYQKRGFSIAALHVKAVEQSRKLKPDIPKIGMDGIPLRDEIEFEMLLK